LVIFSGILVSLPSNRVAISREKMNVDFGRDE